ncbi:hypothetical protein IFM89_017676 [Coptis chinensis]|uniref:Protein TIFY n=1 Tax=Coptis chinensis TaxID=261450 RepID=A0A835GYG0_9MAGN|nr:hypothetical protein IFM89_016778 [Coptis chinensis]KAF9588997.1 hypothetical protein IFM89_017676 [Coptis chinensis]
MKETSVPLAMRRNCNLDLCLVPPAAALSTSGGDAGRDSMNKEIREKQHQQLTIFYNGRINVLDVTEFQARAIIYHARRETDEKLRSPHDSHSEPASPYLQSQLHSPNGVLMKKSLQSFLQKRKNRIKSTNSPYQR